MADELKDKLGPLPAEYFAGDFSPRLPVRSQAADLTDDERRLLDRVLAANPSLSEEEALKQLRAGGL